MKTLEDVEKIIEKIIEKTLELSVK
jgi:hypothetical protein